MLHSSLLLDAQKLRPLTFGDGEKNELRKVDKAGFMYISFKTIIGNPHVPTEPLTSRRDGAFRCTKGRRKEKKTRFPLETTHVSFSDLLSGETFDPLRFRRKKKKEVRYPLSYSIIGQTRVVRIAFPFRPY